MKMSTGLLAVTMFLILTVAPPSYAQNVSEKTIANAGTIVYQPVQLYQFLDAFHSGRSVTVTGGYLYARTMRFANITEDGDLVSTGQWISDNEGAIDWSSLNLLLEKIIVQQGRIPILGLWVTNFEDVSEAGYRAFLTRLSSKLTELNGSLIWLPAWEFNQHEDWGHPEWNWGLGTAGSPRNWYIEASTYVSIMKIIRSARDSLGIKNILIGAQPDSLFRYTYPNWAGEHDPYPLTGQRVLMNYKEGIAQADVIGCSMYVSIGNNDVALTNATVIQQAFDWMHKIHDYVDPTKPFFAFEYNSFITPSGNTNANTFFIENSYAQIPSSFSWGFRAISWYVPFNSSVAWQTASYWAGQYDGWTPQ